MDMSRKSLARFALAAALSIPGGLAMADSGWVSSNAPSGGQGAARALGTGRTPAADDLTLSSTMADVVTPKMLADAAPPPRKISADAGVTFATDYISRGIQLENQGLIAQPYGDIYFTAYEGSGTMSKLTLFGGLWSSLHSEHTGATPGNTVEAWYEFDWDVGFAVDVGKFNLNVMYIEFISPNGAFGTAHNLQFKLSYNDSDSKFPLSPYGIVFVELDGKAGTGTDEGVYFEVGVAPGMPLTSDKDGPKVTFPVFAGFGASDFYGNAKGDDEWFGYVAGGVVVSTPIKFLNDTGYGTWTLSAGGYAYYFGPGVHDANKAVGTDSYWDCVANVSVGVAF
jgi:hypothetical protein